MHDIPDDVLNPKLYRQAERKADETYKRNSLYKSAFLVKTYRELGGKYRDEKKKEKDSGVKKWFSQKWVSMGDFIEGKITPCGRSQNDMRKFPACRPMKKQGEKILTAQEVLDKYGKTKIKNIIAKKRKNPNLRINWEKGTVE